MSEIGQPEITLEAAKEILEGKIPWPEGVETQDLLDILDQGLDEGIRRGLEEFGTN